IAANGFERFRNAGGWRVAVPVLPHRFVDSFDQVLRRFEVKNIRIADIESENLVALLRDFVGDRRQVTNGIANIVEPLSGGYFADLSAGHGFCLAKAKLLTARIAAKDAKRSLECGPGSLRPKA